MSCVQDFQAVVIGDVDKAAMDQILVDLGAENIETVVEFCDVTSGDSLNALADKAENSFGAIDLVFANGGIDPLSLEDSLVLRNEEGQSFSEMCCLANERSTPNPAWGAAASNESGASGPLVHLGGVSRLSSPH